MNTKLTLTMDKSIIQEAKKYADTKNKSLSELVANYFQFLAYSSGEFDRELSPKTKKLRGILKLPKSYDYKEVLNERRDLRHG